MTGGTYTGSAWTTSATVTAPSGTPTGSLEGVSPTYVYFDNQSRPLTGVPTEGGSYTVLALFGGSTDYAAASATAMFTIRQANPILTVTAPGGTFNGSAFPATATLTNAGGTSVTASPTFIYYDSTGNTLAGCAGNRAITR